MTWTIDEERELLLAITRGQIDLARKLFGRCRRQRKPSLSRALKMAKKVGAASVTTPDGCTIRFGEPEPDEASNPWLKAKK